MLVLSRKKNEAIILGDHIEVHILEIKGDTVRLGIVAPRNVQVYRQEIYAAIVRENETARDAVNKLSALKGILSNTKNEEK